MKEFTGGYTEASGLVFPQERNENGSNREMQMGIQTNVGTFCSWKNMVRWKQWTSDKCPWCGQEEEDKAHIAQCKHKEATKME